MAKATTPAQTRTSGRRAPTAKPPVSDSATPPSPPTAPLSRFSTLPEGRNPNRHTERGLRMLEDAIQQDGYVAPMTATADGTVIDGNARLDTVAHALPADPLVIEHDGTRPIVMVRTDIPNADDPRAQRIIVGANRIGAVDLDWDVEVLKRVRDEGVDLSSLWYDNELAAVLGELSGEDDPVAHWQGMPEFGNEPKAAKSIFVHFETLEDVKDFATLIGQQIGEKTRYVWHPAKARRKTADTVFVGTDES